MSGRQRALPVWMVKKGEKEKEKEKEPLRSTRKPKTARSAFYCMNEKELVDAAVSFLTSEDVERVLHRTVHEVVEDKAVDTTVTVRTNTATSQTTAKLVTIQEESSDTEKTYVSESDSDIVQVGTKSPQPQGPQGQRSGPEEKEESSQTLAKKEEEEEDDDPLRLVREIFFT